MLMLVLALALMRTLAQMLCQCKTKPTNARRNQMMMLNADAGADVVADACTDAVPVQNEANETQEETKC